VTRDEKEGTVTIVSYGDLVVVKTTTNVNIQVENANRRGGRQTRNMSKTKVASCMYAPAQEAGFPYDVYVRISCGFFLSEITAGLVMR